MEALSSSIICRSREMTCVELYLVSLVISLISSTSIWAITMSLEVEFHMSLVSWSIWSI
uniref:Uncharacterized protein n=1 Tax=Rhizophora mucronata TaxID=61149 RepID=A0A2P2NZP5_RHIMU